MDCATDLPVDVLSKIVSYKIGDPKYLKIKYCHIEALKRIQDKYKISRLGPKIARHLKSRKKKYIYIYTRRRLARERKTRPSSSSEYGSRKK